MNWGSAVEVGIVKMGQGVLKAPIELSMTTYAN